MLSATCIRRHDEGLPGKRRGDGGAQATPGRPSAPPLSRAVQTRRGMRMLNARKDDLCCAFAFHVRKAVGPPPLQRGIGPGMLDVSQSRKFLREFLWSRP